MNEQIKLKIKIEIRIKKLLNKVQMKWNKTCTIDIHIHRLTLF